MGADLYIAITVLGKSTVPDWNAAETHIKTADIEELDPAGYYDGEPDSAAREDLLYKLAHLKDHFQGHAGWRDITTIVTDTHDIYLSGGMSWGDSPTDSYDAIVRLDSAGALAVAGFDPDDFWRATPPHSYEISRKDLLFA